jgi:hypothetical protein
MTLLLALLASIITYTDSLRTEERHIYSPCGSVISNVIVTAGEYHTIDPKGPWRLTAKAQGTEVQTVEIKDKAATGIRFVLETDCRADKAAWSYTYEVVAFVCDKENKCDRDVLTGTVDAKMIGR